MKKIICLLTALCALFLISAVAESGFALDPKRINEAAESVVILEQKDEEGNVIARASGFAALEPGLVITSASFIEDAGEITATTDAGETLTVSGILGCNTDSDVAIIALEEKEKLAPLSIDAEKRVLRGSDCVVIGAQGENISVSIGNMSGFFEEDDISLIQFTAPLSVGSGGSPLFDENGNVAGVTTGSYYDGTGVVQNLNFAVNITEALSLYEIVKEDEIAAFSEWEITDIGIKSFLNPEPPMEFYIENNTNYDVSRIFLYKRGGYAKKVRVSGPKRGETVTVPITQEEYESSDLWIMMFEMP
ncbi:MAG: trypsin-like peptidase domain-containing protein, partial [Clostridia bacterium]|nr:trypsin-like peptidase domain-containing protein [Clostridia bacterium]